MTENTGIVAQEIIISEESNSEQQVMKTIVGDEILYSRESRAERIARLVAEDPFFQTIITTNPDLDLDAYEKEINSTINTSLLKKLTGQDDVFCRFRNDESREPRDQRIARLIAEDPFFETIIANSPNMDLDAYEKEINTPLNTSMLKKLTGSDDIFCRSHDGPEVLPTNFKLKFAPNGYPSIID